MNKFFFIIFSIIAALMHLTHTMDMNLESIIQKKTYIRKGCSYITFITQFSDGTREVIKQKTDILTQEKKYTYSCEGKKNLKENQRIGDVFKCVAELYDQQNSNKKN